MATTVFIVFVIVIIAVVAGRRKKKTPLPQPDFETEKKLLQEHVAFYRELSTEEQKRFEEAMLRFLQRVRVTGIKTEVEDIDRVFVAASAIIPIFAFRGWEYNNINEVLLYPGNFNKNYEQDGPARDTLGMVGTGAMQNMMILSQQDLRNGFLNETSKTNTGIHEFVHLVDKADGYTDGEPEVLLPHTSVKPWLQRMHQEIELIQAGRSDINPYGATNQAEFLAVASEYFFKRPELMEEKHPELYRLLQEMFEPGKE